MTNRELTVCVYLVQLCVLLAALDQVGHNVRLVSNNILGLTMDDVRQSSPLLFQQSLNISNPLLVIRG